MLLALLGAMTVSSAALLELQPGPRAPLTPPMLAAVERPEDGGADLWAETPRQFAARWDSIGIHFSGTAYGNVGLLDQWHRRLGLPGLAYHLVIGNGIGSDDGRVEVGERWRQQAAGISQSAPANADHRTIDICLIGDGVQRPPSENQMRQLLRLTQQLQAEFGIPPQSVFIYSDAATGRGRMFPVARFRQQLLTYALP